MQMVAYLELSEALPEFSQALGIECTNGFGQVPALQHDGITMLLLAQRRFKLCSQRAQPPAHMLWQLCCLNKAAQDLAVACPSFRLVSHECTCLSLALGSSKPLRLFA